MVELMDAAGEHAGEKNHQAMADEKHGQQGTWQQLLYDALHANVPTSSFACSGRVQPPFLCPDIHIEGVGRLGLPLSNEQAATLKAAAEQAPHGKGLRTVVDTAVRDAYQVDASLVSISSSWQPLLQSAVAHAARALDIADAKGSTPAVNLEARLYKLLLYEEGGHFAAHQDTEKEKGMIGTLVVQLPCCEGHTGGRLVVRHNGLQFSHDFAKDSASAVHFAAFFADCEHELTPLTSGMRLALAYNLVYTGPAAAAPCLAGRSTAGVQLQQALRSWEAEVAAGGKQTRMAFLLEHQYTEANLCFEHLKGKDKGKLLALSTCPDLDAHLVLITRTVTGGTDSPCDYKRSRYGGWGGSYSDDDDDYRDRKGRKKRRHHMSEVHDTNTETGDWIARDGSHIDYSSIDAKEDYYHPINKDLFNDGDEPDDEEYEGFTGNAGPTLDQIYRRALLVLWPRSQAIANAKAAGLTALLSVLRLRLADAADMQNRDAGSSDDDCDVATEEQQEQTDSSSSSSLRFDRAAAEVVDALQACAEEAAEPPQPTQHSYRASWQLGAMYGHRTVRSSSKDNESAAVLQLGVQAVELGIQGAAAPLLQHLQSVCSAKEGLADPRVAEALAAAAAVLDVGAAGPPLQQLVMKEMQLQPSSCIALITGLKGQPELQQLIASAAVAAAPAAMVEHLAALLLAIPGLPAVQQAAADKIAAAAQSDASAGTAATLAALLSKLHALPALQQQLASAAATVLCAAGPMQHCSSVVQLLRVCQGQQEMTDQLVGAICSALRSSTAVWQASGLKQLLDALEVLEPTSAALHAVLAAAVAGMFEGNNNNSTDAGTSSSALLSSQTDDSMLQLSQLLLLEPQLAEAYYGRFAAAVAARKGNQVLLRQLLQAESILAALDRAGVQQLVACQAANLERASVVPPFSWRMPKAKVPGQPKVEAFLHGPAEMFTLSGFSGISGARREASDLQRTGYRATNNSAASTYSMTATAQGTGKNACVVVRKTQDWYQLQVAARQLLAQELAAVRKLVRVVAGKVEPAAAAADAAEHSGAAAGAADGLLVAAPAAVAPVAHKALVVDTIDLTDD